MRFQSHQIGIETIGADAFISIISDFQSHQIGIETEKIFARFKQFVHFQSHQIGIETDEGDEWRRVCAAFNRTRLELKRESGDFVRHGDVLSIAPDWN